MGDEAEGAGPKEEGACPSAAGAGPSEAIISMTLGRTMWEGLSVRQRLS